MSSLEFKDILSLPDNYSRSDIKTAYYTLSRHYHPDSSSFNFLSKEEKSHMFNIITEAYKSLMNEYSDEYFTDYPMYQVIEYEDDISIPVDKDIKTLEDFNKKFVEINREENKDNPWSIHYSMERDLNDKLALVKPDAQLYNKNNNYFTFGMNNCHDYSVPGYYTDLDHLDKGIIITEDSEMPDNILPTNLQYDNTLPEYSEELKKEHVEMNKIKEKVEMERRHVQNQRDMSLLKLE